MGVTAHHQGQAGHRVHQLDQAVRRVAQADGAARVQQARQARVQRGGGHVVHLAGCYRFRSCLRPLAKGLEHIFRGNAAAFGGHAMYQHRPALARQQQRQQGREHRLLARAVVAGQHHHRQRSGGRGAGHALVHGVQKPRHLGRRLALDAHADAEGTHLQIGALAVEHLAHQVARLLAREGAGTFAAAANFLQILTDTHEFIVRQAHPACT